MFLASASPQKGYSNDQRPLVGLGLMSIYLHTAVKSLVIDHQKEGGFNNQESAHLILMRANASSAEQGR
jgi:hypothetical protein